MMWIADGRSTQYGNSPSGKESEAAPWQRGRVPSSRRSATPLSGKVSSYYWAPCAQLVLAAVVGPRCRDGADNISDFGGVESHPERHNSGRLGWCGGGTRKLPTLHGMSLERLRVFRPDFKRDMRVSRIRGSVGGNRLLAGLLLVRVRHSTAHENEVES